MAASEQYYLQRLCKIDALDEAGSDNEAIALARETAATAEKEGVQGYALFFAGEALCLEGDHAGGARKFSQALQEAPDISFFHSNYAVLLSLNNQVKAALRHLDQALSLDESNLQAWSQKSICLAKLNRHVEALRCFDQVLERRPNDLHALRNKAISLARLGRESEALQLFEQVLRQDPSDRHARSELTILNEELSLQRTPLGWLLLWVRRRIGPAFAALKYR